jgi:hypothetical protein
MAECETRKTLGGQIVIKSVTLKVEIEVTGNLKCAKEELRRSVMHCNCMSSSSREGESFSYKVVDAEISL